MNMIRSLPENPENLWGIFMQKCRKRCRIITVCCLLLFKITFIDLESAQAGTAQAPIAISATVVSACIVVASALAFGNYDPTSSTPTDGSTSVIVTCTYGATYNVGLSAGSGTGATVTTRKMTSGSTTLNYSLYQDSARSTVWGSTIGTNTVSGTATGLPITYSVYGRISAQQTAGTGLYSDSVTVTVTY